MWKRFSFPMEHPPCSIFGLCVPIRRNRQPCLYGVMGSSRSETLRPVTKERLIQSIDACYATGRSERDFPAYLNPLFETAGQHLSVRVTEFRSAAKLLTRPPLHTEMTS